VNYCIDSQLPALSPEETIDRVSHRPEGGGGFEEERTGTRLRGGCSPLPGSTLIVSPG